jgi:hypothetical protein
MGVNTASFQPSIRITSDRPVGIRMSIIIPIPASDAVDEFEIRFVSSLAESAAAEASHGRGRRLGA